MGRRRSMSLFGRTLRRRIESVDNYGDANELVDHLRSAYPQYARLPLLIFSKRVRQTLHSCGKANDGVSDGREQEENTPGKKRKECDVSDVKLRNKRRKRNRVLLNHYVASSSGSLCSLEDPSGGDLTQSILRENYCDSSKKSKSRERDFVVENQKGQDGTELGDGRESLNKAPKFKDLGGMKEVICQLIEELLVPFCRPEVMQRLGGLEPMRGILLHGPPGCGKTMLAHAIANEIGVQFYNISATELVAGVSGASEENIRELFTKAYRTAPSVIFIDEIDMIASKRENVQRESERRIVTQLMTCMDKSYGIGKEGCNSRSGRVLVIGATNRPDAIDPALRRPGRFDYELCLGVPDEKAKVEILRALTPNLQVKGAFDLKEIVRLTPGFVGADLVDLVKRAGFLAEKRVLHCRKDVLSGEYPEVVWKQPWPLEELEKLGITVADFKEAAKTVQPSTKREGFSTLPNVKLNDIGGHDELKHEFDRQIVKGMQHPEIFEDFGMDVETGILLYGPPGCGKTLIAKAVAGEAGVNFIHIKAPELLNKYVGESETAVRGIFKRARTCSPCIVFLDEVDALARNRDREGGGNGDSIVNQLLLELDGAEQRHGVHVIGATNRPEVMDPALLRSGRFGTRLHVPLPCPVERGMILRALAGKMKIDASVDLMAIGKDTRCKNFSGADLLELMREACRMAMDDIWASLLKNPVEYKLRTVKTEHFNRAFEKISASVSEEQIHYYESLSKSFKSGWRKVGASNTFSSTVAKL